jgi:hypothetical protein
MTRFFIKWWVDSAKLPDTPQEMMKLRAKLHEGVKAGMSAGMFTEWGHFGNGREGYAIADASAEDIYATMSKYTPVVAYTVSPVLNVDQSIEATKKAAAAMQGQ